jgi:ubiquinone/menaquinone biosynthesis C-methylase UbiE
MRQIVSFVLILILIPYILNQVRKPTKWTGRFFAWLMNISHSGLTDWGLKHVAIGKNFKILDVGCGGGRTIGKLAALAPEGRVYGVDYADGSVAAARGTNAGLIEAGRVEVKQASVSQLPFPDGTFDLVTAVETQYYWPNLVGDMQEILRVLAPGGTLLVIAESYRNGRFEAIQRPAMKFLKSTNLSVDEQRELFITAGYEAVQVLADSNKGWLCATGRRRS